MKRNIMVTSMLLAGLCALLLTACPQPEQTVVKYTVTFESNGGSAVAAQEVDKDGFATEPAAPTKTDYTFAGWHKEAMNRNLWNFASDAVTANVTLYARWIHNSLISLEKRDMVDISGGTFTQTDGTNSFSHTISSFQLGKYEVTYELWYTVRQWAVVNGYVMNYLGVEGSSTVSSGTVPSDKKYEPVVNIRWKDAIVFCNAYSEMNGYAPCYYKYISPNEVLKDTTYDNYVLCVWSNNGYRLPSEGEWRYAASNKGGTPWNYLSGALTFYNDANDTNTNGIPDGKEANDAVAVYYMYYTGSGWDFTGVDYTANVGTKAPNALGLYDMSGNVSEYCWDCYANYPTTPQSDYRYQGSPYKYIIAGGNHNESAFYATVAKRSYTADGTTNNNKTGFRIARYK